MAQVWQGGAIQDLEIHVQDRGPALRLRECRRYDRARFSYSNMYYAFVDSNTFHDFVDRTT